MQDYLLKLIAEKMFVSKGDGIWLYWIVGINFWIVPRYCGKYFRSL